MSWFSSSLAERLGRRLPARLLAQLPARYQQVGAIALVELKPALQRHAALVARAVHEELPWATAVAVRGRVTGELRRPGVRAAWPSPGASLHTTHAEDGVRYAVDLRSVMFSKGNSLERHRLARAIVARERKSPEGVSVADFFAGIGYFSLPLAKAGARVYAIEKSPRAFALLKKNVALNRLLTVVPALGDCRRVALPELVDHVVLGYFPHTERYLPAALAACKDRAVLHFHNSYRTKELWKRPEQQLRAAAAAAGFTAHIRARRVVKPLSPSLRHVVLEVAVVRSPRGRSAAARSRAS